MSLYLNVYSRTARDFRLKCEPCKKTSLETFWHDQVWNLKYRDLTIVLFFFLLFAVVFASLFLYSINYVIKTKNILLEL